MNKTVRENLIAAKALIDTPDKWIKDRFADGGCFCAAGALKYGSGFEAGEVWESAEYKALLAQVPGGRPLPSFNDDPNTTHADIMALFDRAIAAQDGQP